MLQKKQNRQRKESVSFKSKDVEFDTTNPSTKTIILLTIVSGLTILKTIIIDLLKDDITLYARLVFKILKIIRQLHKKGQV